MQDLAKDTFLSKWPDWLRWVSVIPGSIIASLLVVFINRLTFNFMGVDSHGLVAESFINYISVAVFVLVVGALSPKKQFFMSLIASSLIMLLIGFSFFANLQTYTFTIIEQSIFSVAMFAGAITAVYGIYKETIGGSED